MKECYVFTLALLNFEELPERESAKPKFTNALRKKFFTSCYIATPLCYARAVRLREYGCVFSDAPTRRKEGARKKEGKRPERALESKKFLSPGWPVFPTDSLKMKKKEKTY